MGRGTWSFSNLYSTVLVLVFFKKGLPFGQESQAFRMRTLVERTVGMAASLTVLLENGQKYCMCIVGPI